MGEIETVGGLHGIGTYRQKSEYVHTVTSTLQQGGIEPGKIL